MSQLISDNRTNVCVLLLAAFSLAGCAHNGANESGEASFLARPYEHAVTANEAEDKADLHKAQASFARKAYGLAEKHFRAAIERDRDDAEAWIGLAASYDQLARYDLADRAYARLERLNVNRAIVLNNHGYSYILRGDYPQARRLLLKARKIAPGDERISRNLALLDDKQARGSTRSAYK